LDGSARNVAHALDAAAEATNIDGGFTLSTYRSDVTVRRLDAGYVVTWLEDGEPCGSETISEKLALALTNHDGGISGINDERTCKVTREWREWVMSHAPSVEPTSGSGGK
jgi:hypothetical protein